MEVAVALPVRLAPIRGSLHDKAVQQYKYRLCFEAPNERILFSTSSPARSYSYTVYDYVTVSTAGLLSGVRYSSIQVRLSTRQCHTDDTRMSASSSFHRDYVTYG